ncbi:hypothetical protein BN59_02798 [Legionella massiliensis]|uniref:Thaumatin family protein n=1 Tax=Legionella massiliensis TaxID=1034943 RepID=A0A078L3H1_9GAMM|nr:hypothetical protein [Legionella massiliensis]CDZ78488.1 hypothetical protein BN59_02798 [Legionella massiliensis]CEE14226.1 hypothetical protein BN1094_02798 [Legionella massiliensis]
MQYKKLTSITSPLLLLPILGFTQPAIADPNNHQVIIYNNSDTTIYPIAEVKHGPGLYHSYLSTSNPVTSNADAGLAPNTSCVFTLPTAEWDRGGRVYLYDQPPLSMQKEQLVPGSQNTPVQPVDGVPACFPNVYYGEALPLDNPSQLVEYTFDPGFVDYDISSVDHMYLPVAVEVSDGSIGYNGTGMDIQTFQGDIADFIADYNWPTYRLPPGSTNIKIPGSYNVFVQQPSRSSFDPSNQQYMEQGQRDANNNLVIADTLFNRWNAWKTGKLNGKDICTKDDAECLKFQSQVKEVWDEFAANAEAYKNQYEKPITDEDIVAHILGWVTFDKSQVPQWAGITGKAQTTYMALEYAYKTHPDDPKYNLNPYVQFIHDQLNANVYAFSVDDEVGNARRKGNSFTIAVAGLNGIKNKSQYTPPQMSNFMTNYGPGWTSLKFCQSNDSTQCQDNKLDPETPQSYPIPYDNSTIIYTKSDGTNKPQTLSFNVTKLTDSTAEVKNCQQNGAAVPCSGSDPTSAQINVDFNKTSSILYIDAPSPVNLPPAGSNALSIYTGAQSVIVNGQTINAHNHAKVPVQANVATTIQLPAAICTVTVTDQGISQGANCSGSGVYVSGNKDADGWQINTP